MFDPRLLGRRWISSIHLFLFVVLLQPMVQYAAQEDAESAVSDYMRDKLSLDTMEDLKEDSFLDALQSDASCDEGSPECEAPPVTTLDTDNQDDLCEDYNNNGPAFLSDQKTCPVITPDKHWGSNPNVLRLRDRMRQSGSGLVDQHNSTRPPIFLIPGLAATRLIAWKAKSCPGLLSDVKIQDHVWLNLQMIFQASTFDVSCIQECLSLGLNQSDSNDERGCKLRPDEGLEAISSLSPGGLGSEVLMGGTNTVYAWLIQWLAEHLGYDVSNLIGLPYDWRLTPSMMQSRDGYMVNMRRKMEAAVSAAGMPGIVVAHSMGNLVLRYFLEWLRAELRRESFDRYVKRAVQRQQKAQEIREQQRKAGADTAGPMAFLSSLFMAPEEVGAGETPSSEQDEKGDRLDRLRELAKMEGDEAWYEWIEKHVWTYAGLAAPLLGAVNPLRAVLSGENMGLPMAHEEVRDMELSFGSTHTLNPVSTRMGFCDNWDFAEWDEEQQTIPRNKHFHSKLACLDDVLADIQIHQDEMGGDPWEKYPALKSLLHDRIDWDSNTTMVDVIEENCQPDEKAPCEDQKVTNFRPADVQSGGIFDAFNDLWPEEGSPLLTKKEQLKEAFWNSDVKNMLNQTWERPLIKHVIMAYGVDIPTEVGYVYRKKRPAKKGSSKIPHLETIYEEQPGGEIQAESLHTEGRSLGDIILMKRKKAAKWHHKKGPLNHSGDGSVPYLSLAWAHTWLLHSVRAKKHSSEESEPSNPLNEIHVSHRPKGAMEWIDGLKHESEYQKIKENLADTGTSHPHGTKYKPEMIKYHSSGKSRTTGIEYTTSVIEAFGVEHKETPRNYDILAAVFTDVLQYMHDDFDLI